MKTKLITALALIVLSVSVTQAYQYPQPEARQFINKKTGKIDKDAYRKALKDWERMQRNQR